MIAQAVAIIGGRIVDPANQINAVKNLYVADGKIVGIGNPPNGFQARKEIHVSGQIVCPGLIDLCARLREPGLEYKATVQSETTAAARAGITTLCCPPDTYPVIDTPAVAELLTERADALGKTNVLPIGALTKGLNGEDLSEMNALKEAGCIAVSNAYSPISNLLVLRRAMEYAATFDMLVIIRPQEPYLSRGGVVHEGVIATRLGLPGISETAETVAVAQALLLIEQSGVRGHFSQLSCAKAMKMIGRAQHEGIKVSADVAAHHLHLTEHNLVGFEALYYVNPPIRTKSDREGLSEGVRREVISAICSDHQPHEEDAKLDVFPSTQPGISSLETLLPLTLKLVTDDILNLDQAIARLTSGPAKLLGLASGNLKLESVADICIFDSEKKWIIDTEEWKSRGLNTPFWQHTMTGQVTYTLLAGNVVYER